MSKRAEDYVNIGGAVFFGGVLWLCVPIWGPLWLLGRVVTYMWPQFADRQTQRW